VIAARTIRGAGWGNFVVGEPPGTLAVDAIGLDGQPVTRIAATLRVVDSTIATLDASGRLRPLRPGHTSVDIEIGDRRTGAEVTVFEPVRTFEGLTRPALGRRTDTAHAGCIDSLPHARAGASGTALNRATHHLLWLTVTGVRQEGDRLRARFATRR
jgi:hypothetical protein